MASPQPAPDNSQTFVNVTGPGSLRGTVDAAACAAGSADGKEILVRLEDGRQVLAPADALVRQADGSYHLSAGGVDLRQLDEALSRAGATPSQGDGAVVPVVEEHLHVGKRTVETGRVRVTKRIAEHDHILDQVLSSEEVAVERVPVNRVVEDASSPPGVRQEGDTTVIPVLEEVLVVQKRLMLKEEVRITRHRKQTTDTQTVTLRREVVEVERLKEGESQPKGPAIS